MARGKTNQDEWVEVRIASSVDAGEVVAQLNDPAVQGAWQERDLIRLYWPANKWCPDVLNDLRSILKELGHGELDNVITIDQLADRDWNALWAQSVQPIRIGQRVVIRPSWRAVDRRPDDVELIIDPKQAFGTGHHATTQLLVEWLEDAVHPGDRVLDIGTGSGILAMLALRLGAAKAIGFDIDPVAVECARESVAANGFGPELDIREGTLEDSLGESAERIDLILANLDRQTLLDLSPALCAYAVRGTRLLVSGLLLDQQAEIATVFASNGASAGTVRERDGWVAIELMAPESCEGKTGMLQSRRPPYPHVHQINVSDGGVPKSPVREAMINAAGVCGDRQRNLKVHGGPDRALCLFSLELIESLQKDGHSIAPGSAGENLTLAGVAWATLKPGDRLRIGPAVKVEITSYTTPCEANARWFRDRDYKRISQKKNPGWSRLYAKVLREGLVRPCDLVSIEADGLD